MKVSRFVCLVIGMALLLVGCARGSHSHQVHGVPDERDLGGGADDETLLDERDLGAGEDDEVLVQQPDKQGDPDPSDHTRLDHAQPDQDEAAASEP